MRSLAATLALALALLLAPGCRHADLTQPPVLAAPPRALADVPVPSEFRLKQSESWVYVRHYRTAHLAYSGSPRVEETVAYLREHLPSAGWKFSEQRDDRRSTLLFDGQGERLRLEVERAGGMTTLVVAVDPTDAAVEF